MPVLDKKKLLSFAKQKAAPPMAANMLASKRAAAVKPAMPPAAPPAAPSPVGAQEDGGDEQELFLHELVEEAAQEAEAGADPELEDLIAGSTSQGPDDVPVWALDPEKWAEAAEAVGLGQEGVDAMYEEPYVVTAYLYRKIDGPIQGLDAEEPGEQEAPEADVTKPGGAAKALQMRAASSRPPEV